MFAHQQHVTIMTWGPLAIRDKILAPNDVRYRGVPRVRLRVTSFLHGTVTCRGVNDMRVEFGL